MYINTQQLYGNHFETFDPTTEDTYRKRVVIDSQCCLLEALDSAGQEEYTALRNQWIRDAEGFVIVYSIYNRSSFIRLPRYHHQISRVKEDCPFFYSDMNPRLQGMDDYRYPIMLVGHDYTEDEEAKAGGREVSWQEGSALARELGCEYVEACAETGLNVEKAFFDIVRELRKQRAAASNQPTAMPSISEASPRSRAMLATS